MTLDAITAAAGLVKAVDGEAQHGLITRVCDYFGIGTEAKRMKAERNVLREAAIEDVKADVEIQRIKMEGYEENQIARLQRAHNRVATQLLREQENIEAIIGEAMKCLPPESEAHAEKLEDDWLHSFFDSCKGCSDEKVRSLWGKILAEESKKKTFSKRTLRILRDIEGEDAKDFTALSRCLASLFHPEMQPESCEVLIMRDYGIADVYRATGLNHEKLVNLQNLGLLEGPDPGAQLVTYYFNFEDYDERELPDSISMDVRYFSHQASLKLNKQENFRFGPYRVHGGQLGLTKWGKELISLCNPEEGEIPGFIHEVMALLSREYR